MTKFGNGLIGQTFDHRARRLVRQRFRTAMLLNQLSVVTRVTNGAAVVPVVGLLDVTGNASGARVWMVQTGLRATTADADARGHQQQQGENDMGYCLEHGIRTIRCLPSPLDSQTSQLTVSPVRVCHK